MRNPSSERAGRYPSVLGLLEYLALAGPEGMIAGDIARSFDIRVSPVRNHNEVNMMLTRHERLGHVRRSGLMEPTTRYNNVQCWRWWITPRGLDYLARGGLEGELALLRAAREREAPPSAQERRAARKAARLAALPLMDAIPEGDKAARNDLILELRAQGVMTLDDIGLVAGLTRERVRQVIRQGTSLRN